MSPEQPTASERKLEAVGDWVLVEPVKSSGGVFDKANTQACGMVVSVGYDVSYVEEGELIFFRNGSAIPVEDQIQAVHYKDIFALK